MRLFDNFEREDEDIANYAESTFSYLNRSARPDFITARNKFEEWFSHFPEDGKKDLRNRFRDKNEVNHKSACFELMIHEILRSLGCKMEIHPEISGTSTHPDFLVTESDGKQFYLETTVIYGKSEAENKQDKRIDDVYDSLNRLRSPNFFISIEVEGAPNTPVPTRKLKGELEKWLDSLDPNDPVHLSAKVESLPHYNFNHDGWNIRFRPTFKKEEARNKEGIRPIGMEIELPHNIVFDNKSIMEKLNTKAKHYGDLALPYVIAANVMGDYIGKVDIFNALFAEFYSDIQVYCADGLWMSKNGIRNQQVSAVLAFIKLDIFRLDGHNCLYHNPYTDMKYDGVLNGLNKMVPYDIMSRNFSYKYETGVLLSDLLGFPEKWADNFD